MPSSLFPFQNSQNSGLETLSSPPIPKKKRTAAMAELDPVKTEEKNILNTFTSENIILPQGYMVNFLIYNINSLVSKTLLEHSHKQ